MRMRGPTTDQEEIRRWAQAHDAVPCEVLPHQFNGEPAILRFLVGGPPGGTPELRPISWASFYTRFHLLGLVFMYLPDCPVYELPQVEEKSAANVELRRTKLYQS